MNASNHRYPAQLVLGLALCATGMAGAQTTTPALQSAAHLEEKIVKV